MALLLLLISLLPSLIKIDNQDTIKYIPEKKIEKTQSQKTIEKLDSLMIKFEKIDSLTTK